MLGEKQKSWFCKNAWTQSYQMPPKRCGRRLGAEGIALGRVGAYPSSMILVFSLKFMTWWCLG